MGAGPDDRSGCPALSGKVIVGETPCHLGGNYYEVEKPRIVESDIIRTDAFGVVARSSEWLHRSEEHHV